jgi:hypothetical protein
MGGAQSMNGQAFSDDELAAIEAQLQRTGRSLAELGAEWGISGSTLKHRLHRWRKRTGGIPAPPSAPDSLVEASVDMSNQAFHLAQPAGNATTRAPVDMVGEPGLGIGGGPLMPDRAAVDHNQPKPAASQPEWQGKRHYIAALSCTHFGARHNCIAELNSFVDWAHDLYGITEIHHCGDLLQGIDPKWSTEAKRSALDDQVDIALGSLPQRDWLRWPWIGGNHDLKYEHVGGLDIGRYVDMRFRDADRRDLVYLGPYQGWRKLHIPGAPRVLTIEMRHQYGGGENLETTLRRFVRRISHRKKLPDFMLCGHPHRCAFAQTLGVYTSFVGAFDVARYARALPGEADIGGVVLGFELDPDGYPYRVDYRFQDEPVDQAV